VLEEQNDLLKEKMKFLFRPNGKDTVTVEELLKLLKRKELANYHQALMELISKYEQRISELTNSYLYERELKQHSLTYCKGLFNLVQAKSNSEVHASLEEIIDYINKYE
jgi:chromosome segregation and condensation protein ScpB